MSPARGFELWPSRTLTAYAYRTATQAIKNAMQLIEKQPQVNVDSKRASTYLRMFNKHFRCFLQQFRRIEKIVVKNNSKKRIVKNNSKKIV